jgi:hypothetical protein
MSVTHTGGILELFGLRRKRSPPDEREPELPPENRRLSVSVGRILATKNGIVKQWQMMPSRREELERVAASSPIESFLFVLGTNEWNDQKHIKDGTEDTTMVRGIEEDKVRGLRPRTPAPAAGFLSLFSRSALSQLAAGAGVWGRSPHSLKSFCFSLSLRSLCDLCLGPPSSPTSPLRLPLTLASVTSDTDGGH